MKQMPSAGIEIRETMIPEFQRLDDSEVELLTKAPFLVCILIAGADNDIDRKEIKEAIHVVRKGAKGVHSLLNYLNELSEDFEDKLKVVMQTYPFETAKRSDMITSELEQLNGILPKLDKKFAVPFYQCLLSLSEKIAESSGGVLGINAVGKEESKYLKLDMIHDPATSK